MNYKVKYKNYSGASFKWVTSFFRHTLNEVKFAKFRNKLDHPFASSEITAVIITFEPNHLFDACLESVKSQNLLPCKIEVVKNIAPASSASQAALELVKTPYYVSVDGDMVLHPTCFERLYFIHKRNMHCGEALASLRDPIMGKINGVRMYRTQPVREIGFIMPFGEKCHDRYMTSKLLGRGFDSIDSGIVEGIHHPVYLDHEVFWKFRFIGEKLRYFNRDTDDFGNQVDMLFEYWRRERNVTALYGLAGLFDGLQSKNIALELNYTGRCEYEVFLHLKEFFDKEGVRPGCSPQAK